MAKYENNIEAFRKFLEDFSNKDSPDEDAPLPFRLQSYTLTEDESKGEILDWASVYLENAGCPDLLKYSIACHVTETVLSSGLEKYKKEKEAEDESAIVYYSATPLARATFTAVHQLCANWREELPTHLVPHCLNSYSVCGLKNTRRKMEDKHVIITDLNALLDLRDQPHTQYYGVFDGHGGMDASVYSAKQLHLKLVKQESYMTNLEDALKKCIFQTDEEYCKKSHRESLRSGTTAVVAVIRENVLHVAWIGDSQVVLVRNGQAVTLMDPHKPDREDEKKRVESLGGCVIWFGAWRVNGTLSVSRAIGDADHKPYVCGDADTSKAEFDGTEDYICLACDGFWDVFNGEQLVTLVSEHMRESGDKSTLARFLCTRAKEAGSTDNITVLVVFLRDEITISEASKAGEEVAVETDAQQENPQKEEDVKTQETKSKPNNVNENNKNNNSSNTSDSKEASLINRNVMVMGSKLQPMVKDRPPHKLFVNKPQTMSSKVSVIVTESSPHLKLPHSVVTHKSPWQSPQVSPKMKRRDTRGSLLSQSTYESDELTVPLGPWTKDSQISGYMNNAHGFFPALVPENKTWNHSSVRTSPSPSFASEPSMSDEKTFIDSVIYLPTKPSVQRQTRGRVPHRANIIMSNLQHNEHSPQYRQSFAMQKRVSQSVPESLHKIHEAYARRRKQRPGSQALVNGHSPDFIRRYSLGYGVLDPPNDHTVYQGRPSMQGVLDTDIAITNSLYNKIKPKKTNKLKEFSPSSRNTVTKMPVKVLYRRNRSRSVL